jgi:lipopolysaccharide export system protein LptA
MRLLSIPLLLFSAFFLLSQSSSNVRIIHSDLNLGRMVDNQQLRILKGSVHVVKDTIHMYCDSAFYFEAQNKLVLLGNVEVDNGQRKIRALKITYYQDKDLTVSEGKVRVTSPDDSLYTHRLLYYQKKKEATATDSVFIWSKKDNVFITGKNGYFNDEKRYFRVQDSAYFLQIDSVKTDSFQVFADKLEYYGDTLKYAVASDSVIILQGDLKAQADSTWYYRDKELAWLKGNPIVWFEKSELTGNIIKASFDSTVINHLDVYENAQAKTLNDTIKNEYNILKGKTIEFFITKSKPELIIARNNASSIYYLSEQDDKGSNYSTSDSIYVFFQEGTVDSIEIIGGAEGTYYPDSYKEEKKFGK